MCLPCPPPLLIYVYNIIMCIINISTRLQRGAYLYVYNLYATVQEHYCDVSAAESVNVAAPLIRHYNAQWFPSISVKPRIPISGFLFIYSHGSFLQISAHENDNISSKCAKNIFFMICFNFLIRRTHEFPQQTNIIKGNAIRCKTRSYIGGRPVEHNLADHLLGITAL